MKSKNTTKNINKGLQWKNRRGKKIILNYIKRATKNKCNKHKNKIMEVR